MRSFFQSMNESYIEKHYPSRSVFEAVAKKASIGVYLFFGAILAGCVYGIVWSLGSMASYRESGDMEMLSVGTSICVIFAVIAAVSTLCIGLTIWRGKRRGEDWLKKSMAHSKLSESELREFERQAMDSDSYILKLTSGATAVLSGGKDGILTRDFVYLADNNLTVLSRNSLLSACMVESVYYVGDVQHRKPVSYLAIQLLSKSGAESFAEASPEGGKALAELLLKNNPQLETFGGRILTAEEYTEHKKAQQNLSS